MKEKNFASHTLVENMIDQRCREVIFRTILIQVMKIHAYVYGSFLFIHMNEIGYPSSQGNRVDKDNVKQFFYLCLNSRAFL
jgi:hypothetical protein